MPPWEVYPVNEVITQTEQAEVLRRVFTGHIIKVTENSQQLNLLKQQGLVDLEFVEQYTPQIEILTNGSDRSLYKKYLNTLNY